MLGTFGSGLMLKHIFIISVIHSCDQRKESSSRKEENYRNKRVLMEKVVFTI